MNTRNVLQQQEPGTGGGGGQGGQGGGGQQQQQQGGGQQQQAFKDAASARTYLADYVHDGDFLKGVPDDKVLPWATHHKSKTDGLGKQIPEGWREIIAGENKDWLPTLQRFASPRAMYESYAAIRAKQSSGELKAVTPFPEKGDDAAKAAWRTENGIPLEAVGEKGYQLKLPEGVVLGDQDKPFVEAWMKAAHAAHMRPEHVSAGVAWYLQNREEQAQQRHDGDTQARMATEDTLRAEWGADYRPNINRITNFLSTAPKGVGDKIMGGRGPDGKALLNDPDVARWLIDLARTFNPAGVVLPGAGGNVATSVADEIAQIEKFMRDDRDAYNKDEKKQARLRELYTARDQLQKQKKAA